MDYKFYDGNSLYNEISRFVTNDVSYVYIVKGFYNDIHSNIHLDIVYEHEIRDEQWYRKLASKDNRLNHFSHSIKAAPFLNYESLVGKISGIHVGSIYSQFDPSPDWQCYSTGQLHWTKKSSIMFDIAFDDISLLPEGIVNLILMNMDILQ